MSDVTTQDAQDKVLKWGAGDNEYKASPADIPAMVLFALAQRGWSHVFGNEVSSQVNSWRKTEEGAKATDDEVNAYAKSKRDEKLAKILDGTLGVRVSTGGTRGTKEDSIRNAVTLESLRNRLAKVKLTVPTGENVVTIAGKIYTRAQLLEAEYRKAKDEIDAEVSRRLSFKADDDEVSEGEDIFA